MDARPPDHQNQTGARTTRHLLCLGMVLLLALTLWSSGYSLSSSFADVSPTALSALKSTVLPQSTSTAVPDEGLGAFLAWATRTPVPMIAVSPLEPISLPSPDLAASDRSRLHVTAYVVQAGDTLASIAERFGLRRETIVWSNAELESDPAHLYPGQVLNILPVDGVYHLVSMGETLASIAQQYQVSIEAIACYRDNWSVLGQDGVLGCADPLAPAMAAETHPIARPGTALVVPGGVKAYRPTFVRFQTGRIVRETPEAAKRFGWPARGPISQEYWDLHRAIDIAGEHGGVVVAAEAGTVTYAEWEISGYGYLVVVDHGEGLVSYYGHLYGFYVDVGQSVGRGQPLGVIGNTGRSTGPHLHFEVRCDSIPCDPYAYLPPG